MKKNKKLKQIQDSTAARMIFLQDLAHTTLHFIRFHYIAYIVLRSLVIYFSEDLFLGCCNLLWLCFLRTHILFV